MTRRPAIVISLLLAGIATAQGNSLTRGVALYEAGDVLTAQAVFSSITQTDPANAAAVYHLGLTHIELGQLDAAIASFERAVALDDDESRYHQRLGEALGSRIGELGVLKQMGMAGRIRAAFERAVELDADNLEARLGLVTFYLNAPGVAGGSEAKALEQAEAIRDADAALGQRALAMVYLQQKEYDKAEAAYRAALEAQPRELDTHLGLGIFLTSRERYDEAMEIYAAWLDDHPGDMSINYQVGRTASISGEFLDQGRAALEAYATGYTPKPDDPSLAWANYRLGLILQHMGELSAARAAFKKALDLDPKHKPAKKVLRALP